DKKAASSSSSSAATDANGALKTVTPDTLTIGTNLPAPGFWNGDDPDSIKGGLEYGIGQALAKKLVLHKVKVVNVSFDALVAGTATGFDVAFSQVTITDERKSVVDFTTPYFSSDQGVLVKKGTSVKDGAEAKALQWGIQSATTAEDVITKLAPTKETRVFQETSQAFAALKAGQIDAVMLDTSIVMQQAAQDPDKNLEVVAQFHTGEQYGGILPKGSPLAPKINAAIQALIDDGTIGTLSADNIGGDPSKIPTITP
ncbi:MAG: ABC transporter substrate-binding protein, partial [Acidimicrobiia bacterium]